jgi:hypothetical protein
MLGCRKITATLAGETLEKVRSQGLSAGGRLSPLLWSLVVDELIRGFIENGCCTMEHADDTVVLTSGKLPNIH